jgi:protein-S-isoprenylcysteine O-methyltransferase Ste14
MQYHCNDRSAAAIGGRYETEERVTAAPRRGHRRRCIRPELLDFGGDPAMNAPARARGAAVQVKAPPLLYGLSLAAALAVHQWVLPLPLSLPGLTYAGVVLVVAGLGLGLSGVVTVLAHRTTLAPHLPVSRLVVAGPYRVSRNPMYTGLSVALVGAGLCAGSWWPLIVAPLCMLATYRWVIRAEEAYLLDRFGADYQRYRAQVRRWL